jgi:predicted SnoaL-like aldol condensation-catalyzing enzyme
MRFLTPSRLIAVVALVVAGLGLGVADAGNRHRTAHHPGKACPGKHQLERNKQAVVAYYTTAFNDKNPRLAVELYGGDQYIQHNPLAANGFDAFIAFVEDLTSQYPDVHIDIRRVFADCNHVVTHGLLTGAEPIFTERGSKVVDIFRLDRRGRIIEHWDVLAPISPTSANGNPEV